MISEKGHVESVVEFVANSDNITQRKACGARLFVK